MLNFLSKNPKLSLEKFLVFGAVGLYIFKYIKLQQKGQLSGEPAMLLKIDKKKMFDMAEKKFKIDPFVRQAMEGVYDNMMKEESDV